MAPSFAGLACGFPAVVNQHARDARIAQLPERAIQYEMMDVHDGGENQKARGEVEMKDATDDPRAGNKERDAAGDQREEVARHSPARLAGSARFALLVVAGDPYVLRGMQDRQDSAAVARLRDLISRVQFQERGHNEPDELRERQRQRSAPSRAGRCAESFAGTRRIGKPQKPQPSTRRAGNVYFAASPSERISGSVEPPVSKLASSIK